MWGTLLLGGDNVKNSSTPIAIRCKILFCPTLSIGKQVSVESREGIENADKEGMLLSNE